MIRKGWLFCFLLLSLFACKSDDSDSNGSSEGGGNSTPDFQIPMATTDVMLQGFCWNSFEDDDMGGSTRWGALMTQTEEIGTYFDMIWLPPSSSAENGGNRNMGYHPRKWADQNSSWGSTVELKSLIASFHDYDCKVIADIVVNHRGGCTTWNDFCEDSYGNGFTTYQLDYTHICKDDEAGKNGYEVGLNYDYKWDDPNVDYRGGYAAARDLDHSQSYVRNAVKEYLKFLHKEIGYDGWRYDFVKGFDPSYIKEYNNAIDIYFSVGEYYQNNQNALTTWVNETGKSSAVFDFECKKAIRSWGGTSNYSRLTKTGEDGIKRPAGVISDSGMRQYAVTFVDNHDTAPPHESPTEYKGDIPKAYAFLLSAPGIPCVFWQHWVSNKTEIKKMIDTRKRMGINSNSDVTVTNVENYYESKSIGKNGELICRIGSFDVDDIPAGFAISCSGDEWVYYTKN